jgi:hypothetical protein
MLNEMIRGMELNMFSISAESLHQSGSTLDDPRPSCNIVTDFINDLFRDTIEEVHSVNELAERTSNEIKIGLDGLVGWVCRGGHLGSPSLSDLANEAAARAVTIWPPDLRRPLRTELADASRYEAGFDYTDAPA